MSSYRSSSWVRFCAAAMVLFIADSAAAQPDKQNDPLSWDRSVRGLFQRYCYHCHNDERTRGDLNLAADTDPRLILQNREQWETALLMLAGGDMPPPDEKRLPTDEERQLMVQFLEETLTELDCGSIDDPGPPPLRRLNRTEYDNAIEDLTGLSLQLSKDFPADTSSFGFDNIGPALTFTPLQVEQYHQAAKKVVQAVVEKRQSDPQLYTRIFGDSDSPNAAATRTIVQQFASRAFRRPATESFVDRLIEIYRKSRDAEEDHQTALGHVFTAVLMAPQFLMRVEQNREDADEPYRVDDYELASRLSFFLWSRGPDEELLRLAEEQKLRDPAVLETQTLRLLRDDRSEALVRNFFGQWLSLRGLESHQPDSDIFPEYDAALARSMRAEVEAFLIEVIHEDRPVTDVIDARYSYVDRRLAEHYGLAGIEGEGLQRIELDDRRRGGILTSAAFLMLQSDPNRTNVPRRGNYIADRILGAAPPPPPPDVPPLEEVAGEKELPLRELLEKHRSNPACANCHARIDPLGFSLQNYDALGRWRTHDAGKPIDASGEMPDGTQFNGPAEMKDVLLERKEAFIRNFAKNLLIYALGRGLQPSDDCVIEDAMAAAEANDDRISTMILAVVNSQPFLYRRNPEF